MPATRRLRSTSEGTRRHKAYPPLFLSQRMRIAPLMLLVLLAAGCTQPVQTQTTTTTLPHPADIRTAMAITEVVNSTQPATLAEGVASALFDTGHQMGEPTL